MNKSILMYVSPQEACDILNSKQTALLRKRIPKDYKGWVYGNVTKAKPELLKIDKGHYKLSQCNTDAFNKINGTIPFRFWFDEYNTYHLDDYEVYLYTKGKALYAWHIKNLEVFDKPMQLNEFYIVNKDVREVGAFGHLFNEEELPNYVKLSKPPKNYQYVYVKE